MIPVGVFLQEQLACNELKSYQGSFRMSHTNELYFRTHEEQLHPQPIPKILAGMQRALIHTSHHSKDFPSPADSMHLQVTLSWENKWLYPKKTFSAGV